MPRSSDSTTPAENQYVDFDEFVDFHLDKARTSIKVTEISTVLVGLAAFVLCYLFAFVVFDQWVLADGFSDNTRLLLSSSVLLLLVIVLSVRVAYPLLKRIHPLYAARMLEQAEPSLKSNLLNLVDARETIREGEPVVMRAMEKRAAVELAHVDVDQAVDRRKLLHASYFLLAIVMASCLYAVFSPKDLFTSMRRALFPTSTVAVPTQTVISDVTPGSTRVPARGLLTVEAEIRGRIPPQVTLYYTTADHKFVDQPVEMRRIEDNGLRFRGLILGENGRGLLQDIVYRIEAGDDQTSDYTVTVIQPPSTKIDRVKYSFPAYTQLPEKTETGGNIDAWEGTTVTVSATANTPVQSARIRFTDSETTQGKGEEQLMTVRDGVHLEAQWKLAFRTDGTSPRFYHVQITTAKGETDPNPSQYSLRIRPDQPPEVSLLSPRGDLEMPANGVIPLIIQATDPDFQLRFLTLKAEKSSGTGTANGNGGPLVDQQLFEGQLLGQTFRGSYDFALTQWELKPGDKFQFWIEAKDNRQPLANRKNTPRLNVTIIDPVSAEKVKEQLAAEKRKQEDQLASADVDRNQQRPESQSRDETPSTPSDPGQKPPEKNPAKGTAPQEKDQQKSNGGDAKGQEPSRETPASDDEALDNVLQKQMQQQRNQQQTDTKEQQNDKSPKQSGDTPSEQRKENEKRENQQGKQGKSGTSSHSDQQQQKPQSSDNSRDKSSDQQGEGEDQSKSPRQSANQSKEQKDSGKSDSQSRGKQNSTEQRSQQSSNERPRESSEKAEKKDSTSKEQSEGKNARKTGTDKNQTSQENRQQPAKGADASKTGKQNSQGSEDQPKSSPRQASSDRNSQNQQQPGAEQNPSQKPGSKQGDSRQPNEGREPQPTADSSKSPKQETKSSQDNQSTPGNSSAKPKVEKPSPDTPPNKSDGGSKNSDAPQKPETGNSGTEKSQTGRDQQPANPQPESKSDQNKSDSNSPSQNSNAGTAKSSDGAGKQDSTQPKDDGTNSKADQTGPGGTPKKPTDPTQNNKNPSTKGPGDDASRAGKKPADGQPSQGTSPKNGEETPAPESPNAVKKPATGDETGPATGDQNPVGNEPQARNKVDKDPKSRPGARRDRQQDGPPRADSEPTETAPPGDARNQAQTGREKTSAVRKTPSNKSEDRVADRGDGREQRSPSKGDAKNSPKQSGNTDKAGTPSPKNSSREAQKQDSQQSDSQSAETPAPGDEKQSSSESKGTQGSKSGKGEGGKGTPSSSASKPGDGPPGAPKPGDSPKPGSPPGGPSSKSGNEPGKDAGEGIGDRASTDPNPGFASGGRGTREGEGTPPDRAELPPEAANLEDARKATNLVLKKLKGDLERGEVDAELLKELGWTKERMTQFVQRLEKQLQDTGEDNSPEAVARRLQFEETLKNQQLSTQTKARRGEKKHERRTLSTDGRSVTVPPDYREQWEAYSRSLSRQRSGK